MIYSAGHSTTFAHCELEGCIYHQVSGTPYCAEHKDLECQHKTTEQTYEITTDETVVTCLQCLATLTTFGWDKSAEWIPSSKSKS